MSTAVLSGEKSRMLIGTSVVSVKKQKVIRENGGRTGVGDKARGGGALRFYIHCLT
jgi:hypothetical protein